MRDKLAKPPVLAGAAVGAILLAAAWAVFMLRPVTASVPTKAFYTDDDGKTYFVDRIDRIVPFDHHGKPAVRAVLFTSDDHKTSFIGYLERYTPEMAKRLEESQKAVAAGRPPTITADRSDVALTGTEFKRPGDAKWVSGSNLQARQKLMQSLTPPGKSLDSVVP